MNGKNRKKNKVYVENIKQYYEKYKINYNYYKMTDHKYEIMYDAWFINTIMYIEKNDPFKFIEW